MAPSRRPPRGLGAARTPANADDGWSVPHVERMSLTRLNEAGPRLARRIYTWLEGGIGAAKTG
jgi:hypothetical protein